MRCWVLLPTIWEDLSETLSRETQNQAVTLVGTTTCASCLERAPFPPGCKSAGPAAISHSFSPYFNAGFVAPTTRAPMASLSICWIVCSSSQPPPTVTRRPSRSSRSGEGLSAAGPLAKSSCVAFLCHPTPTPCSSSLVIFLALLHSEQHLHFLTGVRKKMLR